MTEEISQEVFNHLVDLAALDLDPKEAEYLRAQLNNQLRAIAELSAIPLPEDTPAAAHGIAYTSANSQPVRPDVWEPYPDPFEILGQAPEVADGYIVVPDIPHTTLE